jgi:hypothetical protein
MRVVISASVAGSNRLKDAVGGKVVSLWSIKREESDCVEVDFDKRVCNERRREETLSVKKDAKESAMDACGIEFGRG